MHPYEGLTAALATMHGKEAAIAPALAGRPGIAVAVAQGVDTDRFGSFCGTVARAGTMREAAIVKARAGMERTGLPLGIASEGSFGPHPHIPFLAIAREMIVLVDDARGLTITDVRQSEETNFDHLVARPGDDLEPFLARIGFPDHAVIVRANAGTAAVVKGISRIETLTSAITRLSAASSDGAARIETDMRAHLNPTRMGEIAKLAQAFASRLATLCPHCGAPGFGHVRTEPGLPCSDCGEETRLVQHIVKGCTACGHEEKHPRTDGRIAASPAECPECNP